MSFLSPITALIAAAITIPLLVSLYFLKLRRKPLAVPSTLLWKRAVQDLQVNAPFQRIRNSLLLWLQLLLLALLLLAMARPTQWATISAGDRLIIVIDHSASMSATDGPGGQTRLEQAKEEAMKLVESLDESQSDADGGAMVVSFAERAVVRQAFTNDRGLLRSAIRSIEATDQRSRIDPVWGLIQPHTSVEGGGVSVRVLSDLKLHRELSAPSDLGEANVAAIVVGKSITPNIGIVACSAKRDFESPERVKVFARLTNTAPQTVSTNVTFTVEGQVMRTVALELPAATTDSPGDASVTFDVVESGTVSMMVSHDFQDVLPSDDAARLQLLAAERVRVLLVTQGNRYLDQSIRAAGVRDMVLVNGEGYEAMSPERLRDGDGSDEGFDVVVFDRYSPTKMPSISSLSFGGVVPIEGLAVRGASEDAPVMQSVLTWKRTHPLMRYVQLDDVTLRKPGRLVVPMSGSTVLAVGQAGPLIAVVQKDGLRHVSTSFDIMESRWPVHWSFQVFMVNAMEVLGLSAQGAGMGEAALAFNTGQSASVAVAGGQATVGYDGPSRVSATVRRGRAELPAFSQVGWYEASGGQVDATFERLAVNLLDPVESDLRPGEGFVIAGGQPTSTVEAGRTRREVWHWFAWAALGLLMVEWWVYTGRMRV